MIKMQVDFCNREQTIPGNKSWPRGGGALSREFTLNLSPQTEKVPRSRWGKGYKWLMHNEEELVKWTFQINFITYGNSAIFKLLSIWLLPAIMKKRFSREVISRWIHCTMSWKIPVIFCKKIKPRHIFGTVGTHRRTPWHLWHCRDSSEVK